MSKVKIKISVGQLSHEGEVRSERMGELFNYLIAQLECPSCKGNIETCECILVGDSIRVLETEEDI